MPDQSSMSYNDFDGQTGIFGVNSAILTAANFAAQMAALTALFDAVAGVVNGVGISYGVSHRVNVASSTSRSGDGDSQRGNKWQIHAYDNTVNLAAGVPNPYYQKPFTYEIPTADLNMRINNSNVIWTVGGADNPAQFDDLVAAFEAFALSPVGGALQVSFIESVTVSGG